ncbi:MAG: hypothetical protein RMM53_04935 [Bacteroidia bacterium]|nr:hypothetical protein [Bacteroidia bacterium]MDW8333543.1 hypothetical protein [Bacteroidia bacterium]
MLTITDTLWGATGAEDITVDHATKVAFVSADDRRATMQGRPTPGNIYLCDLKESPLRLRPLLDPPPPDFHPHGIGFARFGERAYLHVVNHRKAGKHFVEIFEWDGQRLVHLASIASPLIHHPNDVFPVGPTSFFVSNDHGAKTIVGRGIEEVLRLKRANVIFFDGDSARKVASKIAYANGVYILNDKLYVASVLGKCIYEYRLRNGTPVHHRKIFLGTGCDNIEADETGRLYVVGHTNVLKFVGHALNAKNRSPWDLWRIVPGPVPKIERLYVSAGDDVSGASVAAAWKGRVLIGTVFEPRMLVGRLDFDEDFGER